MCTPRPMNALNLTKTDGFLGFIFFTRSFLTSFHTVGSGAGTSGSPAWPSSWRETSNPCVSAVPLGDSNLASVGYQDGSRRCLAYLMHEVLVSAVPLGDSNLAAVGYQDGERRALCT